MELNLISIGLIIILMGFFLVVAGTIISALQQKTKAEAGFVGFIGPFPIGFGTSKEILFITIMIALVLMILLAFVR